MYYSIISTDIGKWIAVGDENGLTQLVLSSGNVSLENFGQQNDRFFQPLQQQLNEYFDGKRTAFDWKLRPQGTDFQQKVWAALQTIPYGKLCSYKDIAIAIGHPKAARAVGMANHNNPIPIIIPCHRVIGCNRKLVGYAYGLEMKQQLIDLEQKNISLY